MKNDPIPSDIPEDVKKLCEVIIQTATYIDEHGKAHPPYSGGIRTFWSADEIVAHEDDVHMSEGLVLGLMCAGGDFAPYFNMDYCDYAKIDKMCVALEQLGFWSEDQRGWLHLIYRK